MMLLQRFLRESSGATAVEYGLIATLIAAAIIGGFGSLGNALAYLWGNNNSRLIQAFQPSP